MSSLVTANNLINTWNLNGGSDAAFVSTIQGLFADVSTVYSLANITGLGNEAIILEDTSLTASQLNTLDGITSGVINAASITTLTGAAADLNTAYDSSGISGLGNEAVYPSPTPPSRSLFSTPSTAIPRAPLTPIASPLSLAPLRTSTLLTTQPASQASPTRPSLSDTTLAVSVLNTLDGHTSGTINANSVSTLTGSASDLITAFASSGIAILAMRPFPSAAAPHPPLKPTPSLLPPPGSSPPPSPMAISQHSPD